jgi:hypothetical protein
LCNWVGEAYPAALVAKFLDAKAAFT